MTNFRQDWQNNAEYFDVLRLLASLSNLFSDSLIPYLDYRLAENVFCKYYNAENQARSCTAYDATLDGLGIGIKTFCLKNDESVEKVAEFNKNKPKLDPLTGQRLAVELGRLRNSRIEFAVRNYSTVDALYHLVGRDKGVLKIFNVQYDRVDVNSIRVTRDNGNSFFFEDGRNEYHFNRSKSVLLQRFIVPRTAKIVPVNIIDDPLSVLVNVFLRQGNYCVQTNKQALPYVILPLYSTRGKNRFVPEKSGLNQWHAGGRERNPNEVYIPIPSSIRKKYPDFFPPRDTPFALRLPDGNELSASVCQDNGKALMSNPNKALGEWLLRKILNIKEGVVVTIEDLDKYGIDSVQITKYNEKNDEGLWIYSISFTATDYESYSDFISDEE